MTIRHPRSTSKTAAAARRRATSRAGAPRPPQLRRRPRTLAGRDAIDVLEADHRRIRELLRSLPRARTTRRREALLAQLEQALRRHTLVEERVFYPAFREAARSDRDRRLFQQAIEAHHVVDLVLPAVREARHEPAVFAARATILRELVERHVREEQDALFPRARRLLSEVELHDLAARLVARQRLVDEPTRLLTLGALIELAT